MPGMRFGRIAGILRPAQECGPCTDGMEERGFYPFFFWLCKLEIFAAAGVSESDMVRVVGDDLGLERLQLRRTITGIEG